MSGVRAERWGGGMHGMSLEAPPCICPFVVCCRIGAIENARVNAPQNGLNLVVETVDFFGRYAAM